MTRTTHHIKHTPVLTEQYLGYEITKANYQSQHIDDFDKVVIAYSVAYDNASHTAAYAERHINDNEDLPEKKAKIVPKLEIQTVLKLWNAVHNMIGEQLIEDQIL